MGYVREIFEDNATERWKFENISTHLSNKTDVNAFMLLDKIAPGFGSIILSVGGGEMVLDVSEEMLVEAKASKEDILDLIRCGVTLGSDGYLCMYV